MHPSTPFEVDAFELCDSDDPLDRILCYDLRTSLPERILMLTDKMSMACSIEARAPLLDHRVVEFAARLPVWMKVNGMRTRFIQREAFRGRLPGFSFRREKRGFGAPVGSWFRKELRGMLHDLTARSRLERQGLFDATLTARLMREHEERQEDHTDALLALFTFQLWYSQHFELSG